MSTTAQSSASTDSVNGDKLQVQEIEIPVPWGHISGKSWGPIDQQPILALHGWMDNAGSFDTLIPLLSDFAVLAIDFPGHGTASHIPYGLHYRLDFEWWGPKMIQPIVALHGRQDNAGTFDTLIPSLPDNVSVLCLDMPGHGLSSHYPKGQSYYVYWDGIILLRRIVKYFQWSKVKLLGHSMGGAIAFLYAATYPDEVEFLICLDIASPSIWDLNKVASTMGQDIDRILKFETTATKSPSYKYNDMIDIVFDAHGGSLDREGAEILMKRGMKPANTPDTYSFSRDVRLKMRTLAVFPLEFSLILASQIKCQYLNIRYVPGIKYDNAISYQAILDVIKKGAKRFQYHEVEGTHHAHLMHPERVAPIITNFLRSK